MKTMWGKPNVQSMKILKGSFLFDFRGNLNTTQYFPILIMLKMASTGFSNRSFHRKGGGVNDPMAIFRLYTAS